MFKSKDKIANMSGTIEHNDKSQDGLLCELVPLRDSKENTSGQKV